MKKLRQIILSINDLRKSLGFSLVWRAAEFNHHLEIVDSLPCHRVLVLSPHPDDDIFGLGGTIAKLTSDGAAVAVAYFCDGSGGTVKVGDYDKKLIAVRRDEAKKAGEILKIKSQVFFGYPDGKLAAESSVNLALNDLNCLISRVKPDIIFVPSFLDNHPDHRAVNQILLNSMAKDQPKLEVWAYEVWTPIFVNRLVDITAVAEQKRAAMQTQKSQLKARGYDKAIWGLNQYRAEINKISGFAEGFFATTFEIYRELYKKS